jgi:hypothetical protein
MLLERPGLVSERNTREYHRSLVHSACMAEDAAVVDLLKPTLDEILDEVRTTLREGGAVLVNSALLYP